ncbi:hypothetical protein ACS0TY_005194 [Phlomoides rotata]
MQNSADWGDIDSFCTKYDFYPDQEQHKQMMFVSNEDIQHFPYAHHVVSLWCPHETRHNNMICQPYQKLSTERILKLAGERFIHFSSKKFININMSTHPYGSSLSDLSVEDKQDVELAQLLLAVAEKVGNQQLERAMRLLENYHWMSSNVGTPVQRAVFYFSEALRERISDEKGDKR